MTTMMTNDDVNSIVNDPDDNTDDNDNDDDDDDVDDNSQWPWRYIERWNPDFLFHFYLSPGSPQAAWEPCGHGDDGDVGDGDVCDSEGDDGDDGDVGEVDDGDVGDGDVGDGDGGDGDAKKWLLMKKKFPWPSHSGVWGKFSR